MFRTNNRLWLLASICLFVALGFVDPMAGAVHYDTSLWGIVGGLLRHPTDITLDILVALLIVALLRLVPAVIFGWVMQALIVIAWSSIRHRAPEKGDSRDDEKHA
jgi:hypothetical protein